MFKLSHFLRWGLGAFVPLALSTSALAAGLTLTTRYGDTGGLVGNLNNVGDQVNGRNICPQANTNANATPGCDMSADPGYQANDPGDNSDDTYNGDLIVRTNDKFKVIAAYSWLGNAGGSEERVTITGTLPAGAGFIWDDLPGVCDANLSSISADRKTITCVRVDFDTNNTGSFAEDLPFAVKVEGDAANDSTPGDISFTIDTPNNAGSAITDGVEDGNSDNLIKVTAAPRWNIDKSRSSGFYWLETGQEDQNGNPGWTIWYNFIIEVDEVDGENDSGVNPRLGNEALQGGKNATVTFVDDLSNISPNAELMTWGTRTSFNPVSNACDMDTYANSNEPYPYFNASYPDRSIPVPAGTMNVTCTQSGSQVNVEVTGIDGTLTDAPTKNRNGGALPVNRSIAAVGVMRVFVPVSDVENAGGTLTTTNCINNFNPVGISGTPNFGGAGESEADNCRNITLTAASGSFGKNFRKGWSDKGDQQTQWGGGGWWFAPTDASAVNSGDGTVTPGQFFGTYAVYSNTGGTDIANPALCDVIDVETYEMVLLNPTTDDTSTFVDETKHAVDLNYSSTETVPDLKIEYATGYVGTWPPDPHEAPNANAPDEVVDECGDPSITWYPNMVTAETTDGAPVSKVRVSAPNLPVGKLISMRIKQRARAKYLTGGATIPNDTLLINHASYRSALNGNVFRAGTYIPNDAGMNHQAVNAGDRLIMVRAKARITKDMSPTNLGPGGESTVTLAPSFTTEGSEPETSDVIIADLLPTGLKYKNGSTTGTYGAGTAYGEPTVISPVTDTDCNTHVPDIVAEGHPCGSLNGGTGNESILIWNMSSVDTGTVFNDLQFVTFVDIAAPPGTLKNYVQISSPADSSASAKRVANANVTNSVPSSLLIVKEVLTPQHEVNTDPLLNWMQFRVSVRNGSSIPLSDLDIIDILPFNGDGVMGSFTFSPDSATTVNRQRAPATSYNGDFAFDSAGFDMNGGVCSGNVEFWYTNAGGPLDISPANSANAIPGGSVSWCQGDASGPAASCGFSKTDVTAVRTRGVNMAAGATCHLNVTYATSNNVDGDIYSNTASAKATGVTKAVLSNTVSAEVFAGSIGDAVWHDVNNNGVFDAGEELENVTVTLTPPAGVDLGSGPGVAVTTTTNASGNYLFDNLPAGGYTVAVDESSLPPTLAGATNTVDPDGGKPSESTVNLSAGEQNLDQDFGYYAPPPINADDDAYTTTADTPVAITPLVNDTPGTSITEINGVTLTGNTQSIPVPNGTVEIDAAGKLTFVPNPGYTGSSDFLYTISDVNGNTATANVTVTIDPAPIAANDDAYTTPVDTPVAITPLVNDTAGATITEINGVKLTGGAQSIPVPNGKVEIDAAGKLTFVPNPGYTGSSDFPYVISDKNGNTATANVTVTIDPAPIAANDDAYTTPVDTPVAITPLVNDTAGATITEINGVKLTGGAQSIPVPNGKVEIDAAGKLTFVPNPGYTGSSDFPYVISDNNGNTATANVTVTIDPAPIAASDDVYTTPVDTPVAITPLVNDTAGATITEFNGVKLTGSTQSIPVDNGTVDIDAAGKLTFVPNPGYTGSSDFPYVISDKNGNTATANVTVTIGPAPIAANDDAYTTLFDTPVPITPLVNDTPGTSITEINGVKLTGSTQSIPVDNGTVDIDAAGKLTFVPDAGYTGSSDFPYVISDGTNTATANVTVTISAANDDTYTTPVNKPVNITPLVNDMPGATITEINGVRLTGGPQTIPVLNGRVEIDAAGNMVFVPDPDYTGPVTFPYMVRDNNGNTAIAYVNINIKGSGASPEPIPSSSIWSLLLLVGLMGLFTYRRRKQA